MQKVLIILVIAACTVSCSMPETRIYSLNTPQAPLPSLNAASTNTKSDISLVVVMQSIKYLSQPYIASRPSPHEIVIARYSKWDSSPEETVGAAVKEAVTSTGLFRSIRTSHTVPHGYYSLTIGLKRFERVDEGGESYGDLLFDATLLSPDEKVLCQSTISRKVRLDGSTFVSLAKGLGAALTEGTKELRQNVLKAMSSSGEM